MFIVLQLVTSSPTDLEHDANIVSARHRVRRQDDSVRDCSIEPPVSEKQTLPLCVIIIYGIV